MYTLLEFEKISQLRTVLSEHSAQHYIYEHENKKEVTHEMTNVKLPYLC